MKSRPLSYDVVMVRTASGTRRVARLWCAECGETLDLTLSTSHHADDVVKRAVAKGWTCDKNRASRTLCPECKVRPVRKKPQPAAKPIPTKVRKENPVTTTPVRAATPDERMRIRHKLDEVFDDAKGMYLDGYTDQRVAEELTLPRKMIERIREAAYGPVRTAPEIEDLRTDLATLTAKAAELTKRLTDIEKRFVAK